MNVLRVIREMLGLIIVAAVVVASLMVISGLVEFARGVIQ